MSPENLVGAVILLALASYAVSAGADFGGGVWDLLSRGPRGERERDVIAHAIAPIWEANHVWLILAIVLLFVCFPLAFAAISTALHVPLLLALVGVVLRGSAFAFRSYDLPPDRARRRWGRLFAVASLVTPVMLGVCVGAIASGRIRVDRATGIVRTDFVSEWLAPFPFAIGVFALVLFAFLAATYLTLETDVEELRESFRRKALISGLIAFALGAATLWLAREGAPRIHAGFRDGSGGLVPVVPLAGVSLVAALGLLSLRRFALARAFALIAVGLVVLGWGFAQRPYLVEPDLTLANTAAPPRVLRATLVALAIGTAVLVPSLIYLYRLFKGEREERGAGSA